MANPKYRIQGLMLASLLFITDQVVKYVMLGPLALQSRRQIHIVSFFDLTYAENRWAFWKRGASLNVGCWSD
jgi:signal peptidase II